MMSFSDDPGKEFANWGVRLKAIFTQHTPEVIIIFVIGFVLGKIIHFG
jgi:hypothetical protein